MSSNSNAEEVVALINDSNIDVEIVNNSVDILYDAAGERKLLRQLHSLYLAVAPKDSKLKPSYHHLNLKSALNECGNDNALDTQISRLFWNYRVNFGRKIVIIDQVVDSNLANEIGAIAVSDFTNIAVEGIKLLDNDSPDAVELPLSIVAKATTSTNATIFILHEAVVSYEYVQPPEELLTEVGKTFINSLRLKKRIITNGFHKLIVNHVGDLRIALIDPTTLGTDAAFDKYTLAMNVVKEAYFSGQVLGTRRPVAFFPAIEKIYNDENIGRVINGCFYTSSGARYTNTAKGTRGDLRYDPFQIGGQDAEDQKLDFTKISLDWPDEAGRPEISLNGSSDMFSNIDKSLRYMETLFSTEENKAASFLQGVLENASW